MKYLAILDFKHTSRMDMAKKAKAYDEEKKNPDKYPSVPYMRVRPGPYLHLLRTILERPDRLISSPSQHLLKT